MAIEFSKFKKRAGKVNKIENNLSMKSWNIKDCTINIFLQFERKLHKSLHTPQQSPATTTPIRRISSALKTIFGSALRTILALFEFLYLLTFSYTPLLVGSCHTFTNLFCQEFQKKNYSTLNRMNTVELKIALGVMMSFCFWNFSNPSILMKHTPNSLLQRMILLKNEFLAPLQGHCINGCMTTSTTA